MLAERRPLLAHGKPVVVTAHGMRTYQGADRDGNLGTGITDPTTSLLHLVPLVGRLVRPRVKGYYMRNEALQARRIVEDLAILDAAGVDGASLPRRSGLLQRASVSRLSPQTTRGEGPDAARRPPTRRRRVPLDFRSPRVPRNVRDLGWRPAAADAKIAEIWPRRFGEPRRDPSNGSLRWTFRPPVPVVGRGPLTRMAHFCRLRYRSLIWSGRLTIRDRVGRSSIAAFNVWGSP
jgi:hypothetical protein